MKGFIKLSFPMICAVLFGNCFASGPAPYNGATIINNLNSPVTLSYSVCSKDFSFCTITKEIALNSNSSSNNQAFVPFENASQTLLISSAKSVNENGHLIAHMDNQCKLSGDNTVVVLNNFQTDRVVCQLGM